MFLELNPDIGRTRWNLCGIGLVVVESVGLFPIRGQPHL